MFGITLKRSAATVGVVAGLLAAAAPAGAAAGARENGSQSAVRAATTPTANGFIIDFANTGVVVLIGANDYGWTEGNDSPCCRDD